MSLASQSRDSGAVWRCATTPGEVVGKAGEQPGLFRERFDIGGRLGDHDDLPAVGAATLQDRDGAPAPGTGRGREGATGSGLIDLG
jgi:hypothetical protein